MTAHIHYLYLKDVDGEPANNRADLWIFEPKERDPEIHVRPVMRV